MKTTTQPGTIRASSGHLLLLLFAGWLIGAGSAEETVPQSPPAESREVGLSRKYRNLWLARTKGENLAAGKQVQFNITPNYPLTKGADDCVQLTDAKLATHPSQRDDKIWHSPDAVGWARRNPAIVVLDLGRVYPIDRVVARYLGGGAQGTLCFPRRLQLLLSRDGKSFFEVGGFEKMLPQDESQTTTRDESRAFQSFSLEERGDSYVYPFIFPDLKAAARYVVISATAPRDYLFIDELAVLAGDFPIADVEFRDKRQVPFAMQGLLVSPLKNEIHVSTNLLTPNIFFLKDLRPAADKRKPITFTLELPPEITVLPTRMTTKYANVIHSRAETVRDGRKLTRWTIRDYKCRWARDRNSGSAGPFYLRLPPGTRALSAPDAWIYAESEGHAPTPVRTPISLIQIPPVPKLEKFHVSLCWMSLDVQRDWPGFLSAFQHLGFNAVGSFPARNWTAPDHPYFKPTIQHLAQARALGFDIILNDSPFHFMWRVHGKEPEIAPQTEDGVKSKVCPSYRGHFYREELDRVARICRLINPDYIFWDFEIMRGELFGDAPKCSRCQAAIKLGDVQDWDEFIRNQCTDILLELRKTALTALEEAERPAPVIGSYHVSVSGMRTIPATKAFPAAVDLLMPSLYCRGEAKVVHDAVRKDYLLAGRRVGIPYLTTGTYGDVSPTDIELMIYEAFLNGAAGITYYCFADFDSPIEYAAHARALRTLAPFETLLWKGTMQKPRCDNPALTVSAWGTDREMLILLANYARSDAQTGNLRIAAGKIQHATNLRNGVSLDPNPGAGLSVVVPAGDAVLLHVRGDPK
jgi:hypothetical protein